MEIPRKIGGRRSDLSGSTSDHVVIVGAGVAGSALAYALGKKVLSLAAIYKDEKKAIVPYPSGVGARGFHNGRFIQKLRGKAASLPNVRLEQGTVTSLLEEKGTIKGVQYKTKAGKELTASAPLTMIEIPSCFIGLVLENCDLPHSNRGYFILKDITVIAFPIGTNEIRCLVDFPGQKIPSISNGEMTEYLKTVVAPQMPAELYNAFTCAIDKGNIRTMPNRIMSESHYPVPGAFLIGDSLNMRHPLTGGGMTVALSDVVILRDLLRPLNDLSDAAAICKYLESFPILRKPMAAVINTVAAALHTVFSPSEDPIRKEMRQACFSYFCLGGVFSDGLMSLLSGMNPSPVSLVFHCLALAVYTVGRLLLPSPKPTRIWMATRLVLVALGIFLPVIKAEGIRATFFPVTMQAYYRTPPVR
ncbi:SQUALENE MONOOXYGENASE [Salix koriyanagi]|uniref:Squalene monooxygenase n=1 Tax=Salix koriyanagi TaxID=2511006 RepID=A0A9Q0Z028_9ROSI|nr:SQUALENE MONOOXYGENASE [Salix koriyanagi]